VEGEEAIGGSRHPTQVAILELLSIDKRALSVPEMAFELQQPPATVAHVRVLTDARILGAPPQSGPRGEAKRYLWIGSYLPRSSEPRTARPADRLLPLCLPNTYGEFLVEACALCMFLERAPTKWTREDLVEEVAEEVMEEGSELAEVGVASLYNAGLLYDEGGYVRCAIAIADLTEP